MPPGPDTARLSVRVQLDPLRLTVRFDQVEQSAELCASLALSKQSSGAGHLGFTPLVIGAGRVFGGNVPSGWGVFVGTGIRVVR